MPRRRARSTVKRQMIEWWGPIIHEYYAGTEDIGSTSITARGMAGAPGSVGRPVTTNPHRRARRRGAARRARPGTVYFDGRPPLRVPQRPGQDRRRSPTSTGWRTLGDIGYLDEDGYLYLTDRQAHMIISGGVNIYPQEAENVLAGHPAVADVAVIGVPDAEMGEAVKAVVQLSIGRRRPGTGGRAARLLPGRSWRRTNAPAGRLRRRAAARPQRQAVQATPARALLGRPRLPGSSEPGRSRTINTGR